MLGYVSRHKSDFLIACLLALVFGATICYLQRTISPVALQHFDVWFDGDLSRVLETMTQRDSEYNLRSSKVHPLFALLTVPITSVLMMVLRVDALTAAQLYIVVIASLWIMVLYAIIRLIGCHQIDSVLCSCLAAVSASSLFWFTVPDSFSFGSLTILIAVLCVALSEYIRVPKVAFIVSGILAFSITITNFMATLVVTSVAMPLRKAVKTLGLTIVGISGLWGIQWLLFSDINIFLDQRGTGLGYWTLNAESGGFPCVMSSFWLHSMVMPQWLIMDNSKHPDLPRLATQCSIPGSVTPWSLLVVLLWGGFLAIACISFIKQSCNLKLKISIGLILLGQLLLHLLYGIETFLYSIHFLPLIILIVSYAFLGKYRAYFRAAGVILLLGTAINNLIALSAINTYLNSFIT